MQKAVPLPAESSALLAKALLSEGPSPSQALLQEELRQRLQQALAQLEAADREVIVMRHFEDMSNGEVAQALGLSASAATMRYGRVLFRLREILVAHLTVGESRP
jgi:RNA polymerase sigma-70 factor (ECF subfamily)